MTTAKAALLLHNPRSGSADTELDDGMALLRRAGIRVITPAAAAQSDCKRKDFCRWVDKYRSEIDCVIVAGGDGTLNTAAPALVKSQLPFGIVPLGTANDLARSLDIPTDPLKACALIAAGQSRFIDIGMANNRYFFNVAHIGLGVQVAQALSEPIKTRWGSLGYARGALNTLKNLHAFSAVICYEDKILRLRTIQIAVGNGCYYGGGMRISDDAAIDNQRLDLYSIRPQRWWRLMFKLLTFKTGRWWYADGIDTVRARTIDVTTRRRRSVSADGELITQTPVRFRVIPKALCVYAP